MRHVVIEGLEEIIKRDLLQHRAILERTKGELDAYTTSRAHEIKRKKHFAGLVGGGKYDDAALQVALDQANINVRHLSDKMQLSRDKITHEKEVVDSLVIQLEEQNAGLDDLALYRKQNGAGNRLG